MAVLWLAEAARLLGVSDDTMRRWADASRLQAGVDDTGRRVIEGTELARIAGEKAVLAGRFGAGPIVGESTRNRLTGLITRVMKDGVMAQVEMQAGPFRVVSLMSAEAASGLGQEPGVLAVASDKSTSVGHRGPPPALTHRQPDGWPVPHPVPTALGVAVPAAVSTRMILSGRIGVPLVDGRCGHALPQAAVARFGARPGSTSSQSDAQHHAEPEVVGAQEGVWPEAHRRPAYEREHQPHHPRRPAPPAATRRSMVPRGPNSKPPGDAPSRRDGVHQVGKGGGTLHVLHLAQHGGTRLQSSRSRPGR